MPEKLYIFLNQPHATSADVVVLDEKQQMQNYYLQHPLTEIATLQNRRQVIVIIASLLVKINFLTASTQSMQKFITSIPFLLEEELAEDVEQLHFAFNPKLKTDHSYPVAIIKNNMLEAMLDHLLQYHIIPDIITPDNLLFTPAPAERWLIVAKDYVIAREQTQALAFETDLLPIVLKQQFTNILSFQDSNPTLLAQVLENNNAVYKNLPIPYLQYLATQLKPAACINLITRGYGSAKRNKNILQLWYSVAALAIIWLAIALFGNVSAYFWLNHKLASLQTSNMTIYQQLFPGATTMVSPEVRVKQLISQSSSAHVGGTLFTILQKTAPTLSKHSEIKINSLAFDNDKLKLDLMVSQFPLLETLEQELQKQQLNVKQLSASSDNNQVKATLEVTL